MAAEGEEEAEHRLQGAADPGAEAAAVSPGVVVAPVVEAIGVVAADLELLPVAVAVALCGSLLLKATRALVVVVVANLTVVANLAVVANPKTLAITTCPS